MLKTPKDRWGKNVLMDWNEVDIHLTQEQALYDRIAVLERENEELRERIEQLEADWLENWPTAQTINYEEYGGEA